MRREEIIAGAKEALQFLEIFAGKKGEPDFFMQLSRSQQATDTIAVALEIQRRASSAYEKMSPTGKQVMLSLGLDRILDVELWTKLIMGDDENSRDFSWRIGSAKRAINVFLPLLEDSDAKLAVRRIHTQDKRKSAHLELVVLEEERQASKPERLIDALSAINELYEVAQRVTGEDEPISIVGCDSGSDKSFDFIGAAKAIEQVKEVILALWDKVVYFRQNQTSRNLDLLVQSLPLLEKLDNLKESGTISPEECEILKRKVTDGCKKFLTSGSSIPEISDRASVEPRSLLMPEPKMLAQSIEPREDPEKGKSEFFEGTLDEDHEDI